MPWIISLHGAMIAYELASRFRIGRLIAQCRAPSIAHRFANAFLDFSRYTAAEKPETVMAYLNTLFDFMIDVVNAQQGIVNKFLGDGFMAVFGAPIDDAESCRHAVSASLEILERLDGLNTSGKIHPTRVGIGLHVGEAVTGNVGSSERKEYTIIGDVVNLASRLEQATRGSRPALSLGKCTSQSR